MAKYFLKDMLAAFSIFTYFASLAQAQSTGAADINICENVADGVFLTDITNCSNYYICINQKPIAQECGDGLYFDATSQSCGYNQKFCLNCDATTLSLVPLAKTCNKYVMCYAGKPVLRQCCDDLQFSVTDNECNLAKSVDCCDNRCNIQNEVNNIVYVPSLASCNKYYICMSGKAVAQTCAKGLVFNPQCNCCDLPANSNCSIKAFTASTKRSVRSPPQIADIGCPSTGTYFYSSTNPNQYYVCVDGLGSIFTCADGLFYDPHAQACRELKRILFK